MNSSRPESRIILELASDTGSRILFTGATGYLGGRLIASCRSWFPAAKLTALVRGESDVSLLAPDVELVQNDRLVEAFREARFDAIVHCATNYGRLGAEAHTVTAANFDLPSRLLELGLSNGLSTFVNVDTLLPAHISPYSSSKARFRDHLYASSARVNAVNLRIEHFYGPNEEETRFVSWVVGSLLQNVPELRLTPGTQLRDFVHIDDVISAFQFILSSATLMSGNWHSYEIGSGVPVQVKQMVEMAKQLTGNTTTNLVFGAVPYRPGEPMKLCADTRPLVDLGWAPGWSLERGLKDVISQKRKRR